VYSTTTDSQLRQHAGLPENRVPQYPLVYQNFVKTVIWWYPPFSDTPTRFPLQHCRILHGYGLLAIPLILTLPIIISLLYPQYIPILVPLCCWLWIAVFWWSVLGKSPRLLMNRKSPDLFLRKSRFLSGKSPFFTILTGKSPLFIGTIWVPGKSSINGQFPHLS